MQQIYLAQKNVTQTDVDTEISMINRLAQNIAAQSQHLFQKIDAVRETNATTNEPTE